MPDSASLSSGNSSFQQTDSRLTSLTASPLLSQAQSPLLPMQQAPTSRMASPMQPSRLASPLQPTRLATSPREGMLSFFFQFSFLLLNVLFTFQTLIF